MSRAGFTSSTARRLASGAKAGAIKFAGAVTLSGDGLNYFELRPDLDFATVRGNNGIPTLVTQGIYRGFSLPVWTADSHEELFLSICVPDEYDEASDITVHVQCCLDSANINKKFGMQLAWEHYTPATDTVPDTACTVEVQTPTGSAAQYQSFELEFAIDYDIDVGDSIVAGDQLVMRLRRIDADPVKDEITGEVVIQHVRVIFRRSKLGVAASLGRIK